MFNNGAPLKNSSDDFLGQSGLSENQGNFIQSIWRIYFVD